jgi:hypothetical protein
LKRGEVAVRRRVKMPKFVAKYENGYVIQEKLFPNGKENVFDFKCTCRTIKISFK